jgi:hypothetical protein
MLTDLEKRVNAMRIWGAVEEERKEWLMGEIKRKKESDTNIVNGGSLRGFSGRSARGSVSEGGRSSDWSSVR